MLHPSLIVVPSRGRGGRGRTRHRANNAAARGERSAGESGAWGIGGDDLRQFAVSFLCFFTATMIFIA